MTTLQALTGLPNGARFHRADLHIHSFGSSHDVTDTSATPDAIVDQAIVEGLRVIAIADHNEIHGAQEAHRAAKGKQVLVVPAIELSTALGHLLCYLPDLDGLEKFFGRITIVDRGTPTSRCQTAPVDCLNILGQLGGFALLAHVDGPSGFETENPGLSPHKLDVLCHRALLGIELRAATSVISYSDIDPDANRRSVGAERIKRLTLGTKQTLARVLNSDAHSLAALGRNAQGNRKITRIKLDAPSFSALRIALDDNDARVRIEDEIPSSIPFVEALALDGGFLDGAQFHFSRNLNCIIGGRGTGKSTTFEAVRCLTGHASTSAIVDSEAWPRAITIFWRDQAGQSHHLTRQINGSMTDIADPAHGPTSFHIESYGQGETARISKEAHDNPLALLGYLDRFVDVREAAEEESKARDELLSLRTEIEKAVTNVDRIPQVEKDLKLVSQQLQALEKEKAKEVIELQRKLATGTALRASIVSKLRDIKNGIESQAVKATVDELVTLADPKTLAVGSGEFAAIVGEAQTFSARAVASQVEALAAYEGLRKSTEIHMAAWKTSEATALAQIETKRKALEAQGVRLDMAYIEKLAKDEATYATTLKNLNTWVPHLKDLRAKYSACLKTRWTARDRVATIRESFGKAISGLLKTALTDLTVSLKFARSSHSPEAENLIIEAMGWRTTQVPRALLLVESLSLPALLVAIERKDKTAITAVKTKEGATVFDDAAATTIIERLSQPAIRFALERAEVQDLPRLTVTKMMPSGAGANRPVVRDFSKLSLGQQQSTLLALMLASNSNDPLIIDQPEDNLDGEFIYQSLVPVLRMAKERRQVIIVTHNANIAVLGDAEQIIVLKSTSEKGSVASRGSIDDSATRSDACNILEGAREAFLRRARVYG